MFSRRTLETAGFFTIAAALHVSAAAFLLPDQLQQGKAVPAPASTPATLAAGGVEVQAMVEDWETPPDTEIATEMTQPEVETATDDLPTPEDITPQLAALPDMAPPEASNARPNLPPPPPAPRIDPATLDLPELQEMTPPEILPDTALAASERPDRKPARPKPQPARQQPARQQAAPTRTAEPARTQPAAPQRAGQGGQSARSNQGGGGGGVSAQTRASLTQQWGAQINACLARQLSRVTGARGARAVINVRVARNGRVQSASVAGSTGNPRVDQEVLRAVQRTRSCPAAPAQLTDASYGFQQPFTIN